MSNVFVFVCGINPEVYTCISGELQTIVDLEEVTRNYRTYMDITYDPVYNDAERPMKSYQFMQVQCLQESVRNGNDSCSIHLHDYFLTEEDYILTEENLTTLKTIINFNKCNVKSLQLSYSDMYTAFMQCLDPGVFTSLETLRVEDCYTEPVWLADILTESVRTLKCLTLSGRYISLSAISITALTGLTCLQSLYLREVNMTHSNLKCLYAYISQTTTLTQLKLEFIHCSDHRGQYRDCDVTLDLHRLNELKILHLVRVSCIELHVNTTCLEKLEFWPWEKMTARASATLWQDLRAAPVLSSLTLYKMSSCQEMIQTIPTLTQLQHLELGWIDMDDVIPLSPAMTQLECVVLHEVKTSSAAWRVLFVSVGQLPRSITVKLSQITMISHEWRELLLSVGQLQHPVKVELSLCKGPSREEWLAIVNVIKTTPTLSLLHGLHIDRSGASFAIKTGNTLPLEILRMDQTAIDQYKTALATGHEKVYNIRVMIVGQCGVGKTVLTKRLLNQEVEIDTRVPTEGIDVHVGKMTVNLLNGEWTACTDNTRQKFAERKKKILDHYTDENKESAETSSEDISESFIEETSDYSHEEVIYERSNEPNSQLSSDHEQQQDAYDRPFSPVISESSHEMINERSNEPNSHQSGEHEQQQDAYDRPSSPDLFTKDVQTRQRHPTEKEIAADKKNLQLNSRQLGNVCEQDKSSLENENSRQEEELREIQQLSDSDLHTAEVSIWDFAGQYAFYDTHQVFMSWRTIYLLVTDLSKQPSDIVENDDCYVDFTGRKQWNLSEFGNFWLNAIRESSSVEGNDEGPPVILVGTFADKVQDNKGFDRLEEFKRALTKNNLTASNLEKEHFVIDNFSKRDTFEDLRKTILEKAKTQKYWGESKPARWIDMEIKLHDMNINGIKILDKESLYTENEKSRLLIPKQELELFLKYHHECGNLIHFSDEDILNRTVVLEPRFLINAFKKLNPQREFFTNKSRALDNWVEYDKYGILPESLIYEMWGVAKNENENVQESVTDSVNLEVINIQDIDKSNYNKFAQDILLYLEKLGLLAKPIIKECKINELFYFAPSFLKETIPDRYLIPAKHEVTTSKLCFTTKSGYIQSAVFNKLLASCIAEYPVVYVNGRYMLFCGCGKFRFNNDNDTTLYVFFRENEIQIWLSNKNEPDKAVCKKAKEFVKEKIDILGDIKYLVKSPQTHVLMDDEGFSVILDDDDDDRFKNLEPRSSRMTKPSRVEVDPEQLAECWFSNGKAKLEDQDANKVTENEYAREKRFNKNCIYNGRLIELTKDEKDKIVNYCGGKTTFAGLRKIQALKSEGFAVEVAIRRVSVDEKLKKDYVLRKINASRFRHPFIAPTYTIFVKENVFYFISPYCKNGALESALHQPDPSHRTNECCCTLLSEANRIRIAFQVSSAILYLRENGLEHGGISSKNIVLDVDLNARLIDFKLSKDINEIASSPNSFRSPSAGEVDQANHDSKCDDTATCGVKDFADFRRVIDELMCYSFEDNSNEISVEAKQTIDDVVECLKYTTTVTDFKEKVVYKLKELLYKYTREVIRGSGNQREQKCVVCNVCLINPAAANDIVRPCCSQPMAACIACIYASSLRCFTCEAKVQTIGDNWGALLIAGKGIGREADEQSAIFQNDAKAIKEVLISQAIGMREENVIEITSNDKAEFLPQLRTAVEKFTCKSNSKCTDECNKVNIAPTTMLIYFSGHGKISVCKYPQSKFEKSENEDSRKNNVFVIGSNDLTLKQLTEELQKMKQVDTFVIILDRCYPPFITMENKTVIQINASEPAEVSKLTMKGSIFTKYFIQAFTGKCPNSCKICDDFANFGNDYVTISDMHSYILKHFEKEYEKQRPCINIQGPKPTPYIAYKARSTSECDIDGLLKTLDSIPLERGQTETTVLL